MSQPLVSIITPSYNQAEFLEATIRSVLEQDYPEVEYIICDGGSTDGSIDVIRKYSDRIAWWCSERDSGQSEAINKGMSRATGSIVAWLNSDDCLAPGCLSTVVDAFHRNSNAGMISGGLDIIDERGALVGRFPARRYTFADQLTHRMIIPQPSSFWRMDVVRTIGSIRSDLHYAMDFEYWIRVGRRFQIMQIPEVLAQFRISESNKGSVQRGKWGPEFLRVLDDMYAEPHLPDSLLALKSQAYAGALTHGAGWFVAAGEYSVAREWLRRAVAWNGGALGRTDWWSTAARATLGRTIHGWGRAAKSGLRQARRTRGDVGDGRSR